MKTKFESKWKIINSLGLKSDQDFENWIKTKYETDKLSSYQISEQLKFLGYALSPRSIMRIICKISTPRSTIEGLTLAKQQGRVPLKRNIITKDMRMRVFTRDNFKCKRCGSEYFLNVKRIVDGKLSREKDNSIQNLETICDNCKNVPRGTIKEFVF